jgi:hypothetical protein
VQIRVHSCLERLRAAKAMNRFSCYIFILLSLSSFARAGNIEITKESKTQRFIPETEIKLFYQDLIEHNPKVKQQFSALLNSIKNYDPEDSHCDTGEPKAVEWMPAQDEWNVASGFRSSGHFLIIQPVEFARAKWRERLGTIVSEFAFVCDGKTEIDDNKPYSEQAILVSNKISIQFLGFRSLQLLSPKNSQ